LANFYMEKYILYGKDDILGVLDQLLTNLERTYPFLYEKMESYEMISNFDIHINLNDGSTVLYNDIDKTFRQLPENRYELTEEQCRREFAYRLNNLMRRKGVTQQELGEKTDISQPQISSYINAKSLPSFYNVDKIAKVLGCSVDELRYC
jgi:DNA-binding Xre family transcriptional regulator